MLAGTLNVKFEYYDLKNPSLAFKASIDVGRGFCSIARILRSIADACNALFKKVTLMAIFIFY